MHGIVWLSLSTGLLLMMGLRPSPPLLRSFNIEVEYEADWTQEEGDGQVPRGAQKVRQGRYLVRSFADVI